MSGTGKKVKIVYPRVASPDERDKEKKTRT
jgi:hypothetical protein